MNLRTLRRKQSRRWDRVHGSWSNTLDNEAIWPMRHIRPCPTYSSWCGHCNSALFLKTLGRFPRSIEEFNDFESLQQRINPNS